jgi:glycosyltransferase involved in cell wall biosynthesis
MNLTIVIPLYNKEKYIKRCLESLLDQDVSLSEYEIIIVDDGSTDSSCSIAHNYAEKHVNIHLFRKQNGGPASARNRGLEVAKGDYIYFLDADDYIATNVLNCLLELCELNKLEILGFNTKYTKDYSFPNTLTQNLQDFSIQVMDGITYIAERSFRNEAWWYIIKKSFLIDTGIKFTEGIFLDDSIFTANLFLRTKRVSKVNFDVHRFVQVKNSVTTNRDATHVLKFIDDLVYAVEKFDILIKSLDSSHVNYHKVVKVYKRKQQSFVFTLFIKAFRYPFLNFNDLKKILIKLKKLDVYPINPKIGGIGYSKNSLIYNMTFVPIFNNKTFLFLGLRIMRLISSR